MSNKPKKEKKSTAGNLVRVLLCLFLMILIAAGFGFLYMNAKLSKLSYAPAGSQTPPVFTEEERAQMETLTEEERAAEENAKIESSAERPEGDVFANKDVINVLFLGTDRRIPNTSDPGRADATMICSLNKATGEVKLISFERGIMVPVPEHGMDLLTNSFRWAGPEYTQSIFQDYFLLDVAGYAQVDFDAFIEIIDDLGGIEITLSGEEAFALNRDHKTSMYQEGLNQMDGEMALSYCRLRSLDSNWVRIERQRNAIQAVLYKVKGLSISELDRLADQILPLVHTNLTKDQLAALLLAAPKFLGATAQQMTVPDRIPGMGAYCDFQKESERLKEFIYGSES